MVEPWAAAADLVEQMAAASAVMVAMEVCWAVHLDLARMEGEQTVVTSVEVAVAVVGKMVVMQEEWMVAERTVETDRLVGVMREALAAAALGVEGTAVAERTGGAQVVEVKVVGATAEAELAVVRGKEVTEEEVKVLLWQ